MPLLERLSKSAAAVSVLLILLLVLAVHPDITWTLRAMTVGALVAGWFTARPSRSLLYIWLAVAPIVPAFLRLLAGREGPVLDCVWMAGLAGGLLRVTPWTRWALPYPWGMLIGGWTLMLSLAWPVLVAREAGFRLAGLSDMGAINSWALMSAPHVVGWILYIVLAQLLGALCFEWLHDVFASKPAEKARVVHALWSGVTVASLVAILQGTIDLRLLSTDFWAALRRTTGTMLDANSYGLLAALAAPVSLLAVRSLLPTIPAAAVAAFVLNWVGMWMSGSRTALICSIAGTTGLVIGLWQSQRSTSPQTRATASTWALITLAALVIVIASTVGPIRRALEVPIGRAGISALWDRGGYGPIALRMTREYPLTGVGVGSYRVLSPDYWRAMSNDALQLDNAQNWWRHQIAELGVFGGALVIGFSLLVAWRVLTRRSDSHDLASSWTVRGLLVGIGAASLLGVPTQNPVVLLWFFALVAWFSALTPDVRAPGERRGEHSSLGWIVAGVLAIAYAGGHLLLATGSLGVAARAQEARHEYVSGAYPPEPLPNANEFRWTGQDARFVWPATTRWLVVRLWAHHPDIATRPVHVTLRSSCGVLFDEDLKTSDPVSVGITLPEGQPAVVATVHVSRTWKPSDHGDPDERELGVGIVADFVSDSALAQSQHRTPAVSGCGPGI